MGKCLSVDRKFRTRLSVGVVVGSLGEQAKAWADFNLHTFLVGNRARNASGAFADTDSFAGGVGDRCRISCGGVGQGTLGASGIAGGRCAHFVPHWQDTWRSPGFWSALLCVQMLAMCMLSWLPFDFCTEPAILRQRWATFVASPLADPAGNDAHNALTLFRSGVMGAVLGWLAAMVLTTLWTHGRRGSGRHSRHLAGAIAIVLLAMFVLAVELVQLLVPSRTCSMLSVFVQVTGVVWATGLDAGCRSAADGNILRNDNLTKAHQTKPTKVKIGRTGFP